MTNNLKVVKIIDDYRIVINAGTKNDIEVGTIIEVVSPGDEVIDPDTGETLGRIDIVKALLKVEHVYEKMAECVNASSPPPTSSFSTLNSSAVLGAGAAAAGTALAAAGIGMSSLAALATPFLLAANSLYKRLDIDPKQISGVSEKKEPIRIGDKVRLVPQ